MTGRAAIVAFYGRAEPLSLRLGVTEVQEALGEVLVPRPALTLHTTLIGLEGGGDHSAFAAYLADSLERDPVTLQFGGFEDVDYGISSRGQRLVERTLVHDAGKVVLVGWPVVEGLPTDRLDGLRRRAEELGLRHRYPLPDPDAHVVIGEADAVPTDVRVPRFTVPLRGQDLVIVEYDDPRLPIETTSCKPLV